MKILMLDKNYLVDRRIELVSQRLVQQGHDVKLLHTLLPRSFDDASERRRRMPRMFKPMETVRFSTDPMSRAADSDGVFAVPAHVYDANHRRSVHFDTELERFDIMRDRLTRRIGSRAGLLATMLAKPQMAQHLLPNTALSGVTKLLMGAALAPLALISRLGGTLQQPDRVKSVLKRYRPLDVWESKVVEYAESYKPDIVVANDMITLRAAAELKARHGCPVVYDGHELYSYQPGIPYKQRRKYYEEERRMIRHVDRFICCNEQHARILERDFDIQDAVVYSNSTLQHPEFDIKKRYDWIRRETFIPRDAKILIFQGGINVQRRIDFVLKGLAQAQSQFVHMVFLTFGQEIPSFQKMADDLGIGHRVHFLDLVPWDEIVFWIASADAGIMPYQGTDQNTIISNPNKMYEFIAAGVPMIGSSELVNVKRVVQGEGFGVIEKIITIEDYARAIDRMFDPSLGGPDRFRDNLISKHKPYLWEKQAEAVMAMYDDIIIDIETKGGAR